MAGPVETGQVGQRKSQLALLQLGGRSRVTLPSARSQPLSGLPPIAKLYTRRMVYKGLLGPLTGQVPVFKRQVNSGYSQVTIGLPATSLLASLGDVILLTQQGGDGRTVYGGTVENIIDTIGPGQTSHQLELLPFVAQLGDAHFQTDYRTPVDIAQMVRDAVALTTHVRVTTWSCPDTGIMAAFIFNRTTALEVVHTAKKLASVRYYWFVDAEGVLWFQPVNLRQAKWTIKQGVDYSSRRSSLNLAPMKNRIPVVGGVPDQASAPVTYTYDNPTNQALYGLRLWDPPLVFKTVTSQTVLQQIGDTLGAAFDAVQSVYEVELDGFAQRIDLGVLGGASIRFWEPDHNALQQSETGTGAMSSNFAVLDVEEDGAVQRVRFGDLPLTGLDDYRYQIDRIIQRATYADLFYPPTSLTGAGVLGPTAALMSAADPAAGVTSPARIKFSAASGLQAFDGTSQNYGLPGGAGETVRLGTDGVAYLAKLLLSSGLGQARIVIDTKTDPNNPIWYVQDPNAAVRVEAGSIPARVGSAAQWGFRVNDSKQVPIWDTLGLIGAANLVFSFQSTWIPAAVAGVNGPPAGPAGGGEVTLPSCTTSITPARSTRYMLLGLASGNVVRSPAGITIVDEPFYVRVNGVGDGLISELAAYSTGGVSTQNVTAVSVGFITVPGDGSTAYTFRFVWNSSNGVNDSYVATTYGFYVVQLGG